MAGLSNIVRGFYQGHDDQRRRIQQDKDSAWQDEARDRQRGDWRWQDEERGEERNRWDHDAKRRGVESRGFDQLGQQYDFDETVDPTTGLSNYQSRLRSGHEATQATNRANAVKGNYVADNFVSQSDTEFAQKGAEHRERILSARHSRAMSAAANARAQASHARQMRMADLREQGLLREKAQASVFSELSDAYDDWQHGDNAGGNAALSALRAKLPRGSNIEQRRDGKFELSYRGRRQVVDEAWQLPAVVAAAGGNMEASAALMEHFSPNHTPAREVLAAYTKALEDSGNDEMARERAAGVSQFMRDGGQTRAAVNNTPGFDARAAGTPRISSREEFEQLAPGTTYIDAETGQIGRK